MKDLFEIPETLPQKVQDIIDQFAEDIDDCEKDGYKTCANFVKELEQEGYTCEYGLDASPFNLRKL